MNIITNPALWVVGSINLDITATTERLPAPGETVGGGSLHREPGGKGANQAAAAARLGARVRLVGAVGNDAEGRQIMQALEDAGVGVDHVTVADEPTGTALIVVDRDGENQIAVCEGANRSVTLDGLSFGPDDAVLTQLETSMDVALELARKTTGYFALNAAPARSLPQEIIDRAQLIIVNETEYELIPELSKAPLVAVTYGAKGATLLSHGERIAEAPAAATTAVNSVGAGDAFSAALTLALVSGLDHTHALRLACAVGAAAVADPASQPFLEPFESYLQATASA
ncbi:ribokinase [Micrococcaceae bacterium Sec5.7]